MKINFLKNNPESTYIYLAKPTEDYFSQFLRLTNADLYPLFSSNTKEAEVLRREVTVENLKQFLRGEELKSRVI